ncbi:hypothetical protein ABGB12_29925 [Actinocorallia sp. B10E7]|uniref:hypothetical protein n=1 Tax=Actinocorallia sp. B10E7 TaxID=3153558 RepID=UPI00325D588E
MSTRPESERSDWTDLDLLTREEAAERVRAEITDVRARLDAESRPEARAALEQRLDVLETWTRGPSAR